MDASASEGSGSGAGGSRLLRITIGGANSDWWAALNRHRDAGTMPSLLEPIAGGSEGEIVCSAAEWDATRRWCENLPGWIEGDATEQLIAEDYLG